jgi:ABC-type multidrug transport system fused ATPase/permease subunit
MGVMVAMNWKLALVTFSVIPLFFVVTNWFRAGSRATFREVRRWVARINAFLQENITGMPVVQLFRREERNREAFAAINRQHTTRTWPRSSTTRSSTRPSSSWPRLATALIILYGGWRVIAGTLTLGALVAFIQYSERFWRPISDLSEKFNILQAAMASSERIFTLLDTEPKVVAPDKPVHLETVRGRVASRT